MYFFKSFSLDSLECFVTMKRSYKTFKPVCVTQSEASGIGNHDLNGSDLYTILGL